jgi:hypothetical protein
MEASHVADADSLHDLYFHCCDALLYEVQFLGDSSRHICNALSRSGATVGNRSLNALAIFNIRNPNLGVARQRPMSRGHLCRYVRHSAGSFVTFKTMAVESGFAFLDFRFGIARLVVIVCFERIRSSQKGRKYESSNNATHCHYLPRITTWAAWRM